MDATVIVKFRFDNVCNEDELKDISFEDMVKSLINDNGLIGVVDLENYEIISIDQIKDDKILGSYCKLQDGSIGEVCKELKKGWLVCNSNGWWHCTTEWIKENKVEEEK